MARSPRIWLPDVAAAAQGPGGAPPRKERRARQPLTRTPTRPAGREGRPRQDGNAAGGVRSPRDTDPCSLRPGCDQRTYLWNDFLVIDEFRAAFQNVLDAAATQAPHFPAAVHEVFRLAPHVPAEERIIALDALAPVLRDSEPAAGIAADLAVLAGALVEAGAPAGQTGLEVLRQLGSYGKAAGAFLQAWQQTGGGTPPPPLEVTEAEEKRVTAVLEELAALATMGWWASERYGLAARTMLTDSYVRAAVRADAEALQELTRIAGELSAQLPEYAEVHELLRMSAADTVLVLDRASGRGFRVRFDGIADNSQLHTLLADALIGPEGREIPGTRPDPRWVAAARDTDVDPRADIVGGAWDLVGGDGTWVGNEQAPADIPLVEGERVLVLEGASLPHSWRAGRRHPHIIGRLEVQEEIDPEEAALWWAQAPAAGTVRHPVAPPPANGPEPQAGPETANTPEPGQGWDAFTAPTRSEPETAGTAAHDTAPARPGDSHPDLPPGAGLLPPLPPGVSDSSAWGPNWK